MKKEKETKWHPQDQKLKEELEKGYPDGFKRFFDLLKKSSTTATIKQKQHNEEVTASSYAFLIKTG